MGIYPSLLEPLKRTNGSRFGSKRTPQNEKNVFLHWIMKFLGDFAAGGDAGLP